MLKTYIIAWYRRVDYETDRREFDGYVIGISLHGLSALTAPTAQDARHFISYAQAAAYIRERKCRMAADGPCHIVPYHDGKRVNGR